jgi:hypothetical protein
MSEYQLHLVFERIEAALQRAIASKGMQSAAISHSTLRGCLKDQAAVLSTNRWLDQNHGMLTYAVMQVAGNPVAITAVAVPGQKVATPILGFDLVAMGGSMSLVAADVIGFESHVTQVAEVMTRLDQNTAALPKRKTPEFAKAIFSSQALIAGAPGELAQIACDAVAQLVADWAQLPATVSSSAAGVTQRWCSAQCQNRREQKALGEIFGSSTIEKYMQSTMFAVNSEATEAS